MKDWAVSLIATVRNERSGIAPWLKSIDAQTRRPDEVVLCDGGSSDGTLEEFKRLAAEYPRLKIRIVEKPGANIAAGRNAAIAVAAGPIIAVTDAGCRPEPSWLEELIKPFKRELKPDAPQFVAGYYRYEAETPFQRSAAAYLGPAWERPNFRPSSRSVAFTLGAWKLVGGYPEWLTLAAEDTLFNYSIFRRSEVAISHAPGAIVHWEMRGDLNSFLRMIRRNAFGDAEAGLGRTAFLKTASRLIALIFAVTVLAVEAAFAPPEFLFSIMAPLVLGLIVIGAVVLTRKLPKGASRIDFLLLKIFGGPSYVLGYLQGLCFGRKPPR